MDASAVRALVEAGLGDCRVEVEGGDGKYLVTAVGEQFEGLSPVRRQKLVYATLTDRIADGSVHAVQIRAFTPQQWSEQNE